MKQLLMAFKEHKEFKKNRPWSIWETPQGFDSFMTPPHYAETIEILIYRNVSGDIHIGGQHFKLDGNKVFFVAPNVIHAMNYAKSEGKISTLKISPPQLKPLLDLDTLLEYHGKSYTDFPILVDEFDRIHDIVSAFKKPDDINGVLTGILSFFQMLIDHSSTENNVLGKNISIRDDELRSILTWSEQNFTRRITLEDVSLQFGYSRNYFCKKFKKATGITYLAYLNNLRISHACKLLKANHSISDTCDECGFEDISYFIQLFKKIMGITPKKYIMQMM